MKRPFSDILCAGAAVAVALAISSAWAHTNAFVGRWHWNPTQSKLPPGDTAPTDLIAEISRGDDQQLAWSVTIMDTDNKPHVEQFDAPADGQFHQIDGDTTAAFHVTDDSLQATFKGSSGQSDVFICGLSEDKKRMTCNGTVDDAGGATARYVDVYDRL